MILELKQMLINYYTYIYKYIKCMYICIYIYVYMTLHVINKTEFVVKVHSNN